MCTEVRSGEAELWSWREWSHRGEGTFDGCNAKSLVF